MKSFINLFLLLGVLFPRIFDAQTVIGKLVDQNGNALSSVQVKLYINQIEYNATTIADGSFSFSGVVGIENSELPTEYSVSNNYPNPFNPKTRFIFTKPEEGIVRIEVFNSLGQKVLTTFEKYFAKGANYIDLELNGLSNGIYIANIKLNDKYSVTKKLVLMYGSNHLNVSCTISDVRMNMKASLSISYLSTQIDSLVATNVIIGRKVFKNLPSISGSSLNLNTLAIDRTCPGVPTVIYEGKTYNTVLIGTQCWLKENLDVGTMIQSHLDQTNNGLIEKYCYFNVPNNCALYGGLYQWSEAMAYNINPGTKGICPEGWHIPSYSELLKLGSIVNQEGNALKSKDQGTGNGAGTNTSGFSGLLAGYRDPDFYFYYMGTNSFLWSSDLKSMNYAYLMALYSSGNEISFDNHYLGLGLNIRCIKN